MSKTTLGFIFTALVYFILGITLGVLFLIIPETRMLQAVHTHLNLVGFVIFLIFGVAYHILPRFRGNPLYSEKLAWWQFLLANVGLAGLLVFLGVGAYTSFSGLRVLQAVFGTVLALSSFLFAYNMYRSMIGQKTE